MLRIQLSFTVSPTSYAIALKSTTFQALALHQALAANMENDGIADKRMHPVRILQ